MRMGFGMRLSLGGVSCGGKEIGTFRFLKLSSYDW